MKFSIYGQTLETVGTSRIVSDTINYVDAEFRFRTVAWENAVKWAHFVLDKVVYDIQLVDDKITEDMGLFLTKGRWQVYVHGEVYDEDGNVTQRITTQKIYINIEYSGILNGMPLPDILPTAEEQIDAKADAALNASKLALEKLEELQARLETAIVMANAATEGARQAEAKANRAAVSANDSAAKADSATANVDEAVSSALDSAGVAAESARIAVSSVITESVASVLPDVGTPTVSTRLIEAMDGKILEFQFSGLKGEDYNLTDADRSDIATIVENGITPQLDRIEGKIATASDAVRALR